MARTLGLLVPTAGRRAPSRGFDRGAIAIASAAAAAMIAIALARLSMAAGTNSGLTFLHAVPIALIAVRLGAGPAAVAVAAALALVGAWDSAGGQPGVVGYAVRGVVFSLIAFLGTRHRADLAAAAAAAQASEPVRIDHNLSPRELEVLRLIAHGHTNREIAEMLVLSVRTVETHRARIYSKLQCSGRAALYQHALTIGLVDAPERVRAA